MTARRVAWGIWGLTVTILVAWFFVAAAAKTISDEWIFYVLVPIAIIAYATVGALITSRHPENRIGAILAGVALAFAISIAAGDYATLASHRVGAMPFARWVAWIGRVTFALWLAPLPLLFLLYPNGRVLSRRWRPVLWVLLAALAVNVTFFALTPGPIESGFSEPGAGVRNPVGLPLAWRGPIQGATELAGLIAFACAGLAAISLVLRFRRAPADERQQIRWLGYVGAVLLAVPLVGIVVVLIREIMGVHVSEDDDVVGVILWSAFMIVLLFGIPAACAIAILRYRLYDLDLVIKKTVLYAIVALLLIGLFLVFASVLGGALIEAEPAAIAASVALGIAFWPATRLARRLADRIVYGGRATPYEVLSDFSQRVGGSFASEDVLLRMATILGDAVGAREAAVWLRVGKELRPVGVASSNGGGPAPVAVSGDELPSLPADAAVEVRDRGELLGALSVSAPANDPITPSKERLIHDLAGQAGLVLRNVRLIEELRASRQRLVAAQDDERRRLERNIHDGAQQQLVALSVKLKLLEQLAGRDAGKTAHMAAQLQTDATVALEDLRDLARGIYPPLLADQGLPAALAAQARKSTVPVDVRADGVGRFPQDVEAAIYFACLEAMQNVAKYANASSVTISIVKANGEVSFVVADDGVGFDPDVTTHGTGLQGIADRIDALDGRFAVASRPGSGTTLSGSVPVDRG